MSTTTRACICVFAATLLAACARTPTDAAAAGTTPTPMPSTAASTQERAPASTAQTLSHADAPTAMPAPAAGMPGLPAASGPTAQGERIAPLPDAIAAVLLALPTRDVLVPRELRQRALASGKAHVVDVARAGGPPDVLASDEAGSRFHYWIRSFHGNTDGVNGYLVQVRVSCRDLAQATLHEPATEATAACAAPHAEFADSGLRAYRVVGAQAPEDVTGTLADPRTLLTQATTDRYRTMGASDVFVDDSRLAIVPVIRWVVEFDPENASTTSDPQVYDAGGRVHAGFVVWTGDRFQSRPTVPRTLWPCPKDKPSLCPDDDRFVTGAL